MKASDDELRDVLRRSRADREGCPSAEVLAQVAEGMVADDGLVSHLAGCPDCAVEYRMASTLRPWAEAAAASFAAAPVSTAGSARAARLVPGALAASLAACLALGASVLWVESQRRQAETRWSDARQEVRRAEDETARLRDDRAKEVESLRRELEDLTRPQGQVPLVDLFPGDPARGGASSAATLDLPSGGGFAVLILNTRGRPSGAAYAVEIQDGRGQTVWSGDVSRPGAEPLTLGIPSRLLPEGRYRIRLHLVQGARRALVEEYSLRVRGGTGSRP